MRVSVMFAAALLVVAVTGTTARADQILFTESFDGPGLPTSMVYGGSSFFEWSRNDAGILVADRTEASRGVALARSIESFTLDPDDTLTYSALMGKPAGASESAYNVGLVFGNYIALFHPGLARGQYGAFRLEKIVGALDPLEPALIENTEMGFAPALGVFHYVEATVQHEGSGLRIDILVTGLGLDGVEHTFSTAYLDTSPALGAGYIGVSVRGGAGSPVDDGWFDSLEVRGFDPIPEPSTWALLLLGAVAVALVNRRASRR